jgi:hypothetical protein
MSSPQAPMPNTGDTVCTPCQSTEPHFSPPPFQRPVQDCPSARRCLQAQEQAQEQAQAQAQARMRDKATYAFNQKCAVQRRQHVS